MEFWIFIIAVAALAIALSNQTAIKNLKNENQQLRAWINQTLHPNGDIPQQIPPHRAAAPQPQVQRPPAPTIQKPAAQRVAQPKEKKNMENIVGKNVIGIVATILMFIGVFAFGTLIFTSLTDTIKVVGMFTLAFAITGFGIFLSRKGPTVFSNCVAGCGIGVLYISIFLTHLYFHMISDIATFVLVFLWAVAVSVLSKKFKLQSLSYIALAGCIISSILAQVSVVEKQMFAEITVYHMLTFVLLIVANKSNHALFKISSFAAMLMNIVLSMVIFTAVPNGNTSWLYLCFLLGVYNLAIGILSYTRDTSQRELDDTFTIIGHLTNIALTLLAPLYYLVNQVWFYYENIATFNVVDAAEVTRTQTTVFWVLAMAIVAIAYLGYHFIIKDKRKRMNMLITTESLMAALTVFFPITFVGNHQFGFVLLISVVNLILARLCQNKTFYWSGFVFLLIDCCTSIFFALQYQYTGFLYSIILIAISLAYMKEKYGDMLSFPCFQGLLINVYLLVTIMNLFDGVNGGYMIACILIVLLNMALTSIVQLRKQPVNTTSVVLTEVMESILAFAMFFVVMANKDEFVLTSFILSLLLIPFSLIKLSRVVSEKNAFMSVWYGIKFTFYTFALTDAFTSIWEQQFIVSVFFMIIATLCITFGFMKQLKPLRIYGLVLIMSSVFKMVILDVWNQTSMIRVASLIVGALICFGISAGYSKIEAKQKQFDEIAEES